MSGNVPEKDKIYNVPQQCVPHKENKLLLLTRITIYVMLCFICPGSM